MVQGLAAEILAYLRQHPHKADSALHIARWWLLQSRVEAALDQVQRALDLLRESGAIEMGNGGIYRLPRDGGNGLD